MSDPVSMPRRDAAESEQEGEQSWGEWAGDKVKGGVDALRGAVGYDQQQEALSPDHQPSIEEQEAARRPNYVATPIYTVTDGTALIRSAPPEGRSLRQTIPQGTEVLVRDEGAGRSEQAMVDLVEFSAGGTLGQAFGWTNAGNLTVTPDSRGVDDDTAQALIDGPKPQLSITVDGTAATVDTYGPHDELPEPEAVAEEGIEALMELCTGLQSWVTLDETVVQSVHALTGGERVYARDTPSFHEALAAKLSGPDFGRALRGLDVNVADMMAAHLHVGYEADYLSDGFVVDVSNADMAALDELLALGDDMAIVGIASGVDPTTLQAFNGDRGALHRSSSNAAFRLWVMGLRTWDAAAYDSWVSGLLQYADEATRQAAFSSLTPEQVTERANDSSTRRGKKSRHGDTRTRVEFGEDEVKLSEINALDDSGDYGANVDALVDEHRDEMSTCQEVLFEKVTEFLATRPEPAGAYAGFGSLTVPGYMAAKDGLTLDGDLIARMQLFTKFAAWAGLLTGPPRVSSGVRSPKRCHQLSVNYMFTSGIGLGGAYNRSVVAEWAIKHNGADVDNNTWIPENLVAEIKAADKDDAKLVPILLRKVKATFSEQQTDQAAEGYPRGDARREPNRRSTGVSLHATGGALDVTYPWIFSNTYDPMIDLLAAYFGLYRPVKDSQSSPEDWHYQKIGTVVDPTSTDP